jgi:hypothetical protein
MPVGDCERLLESWVSQPVNAVSSLAFVLVGLRLLVMFRSRSGPRPILAGAFAAVLVLVGIGSFAFHGPGGVTADWVHDGSITALLALIVALELRRRAGWSDSQVLIGWSVAAAGLVLVELLRPGVGDPLNAPLAVAAIVGVMAPQLGPGRVPQPDRRRQRVFAAVGVLALGAIVMLLSRTGAPLCFPDAVVQGHAIWHVLAALGIGIYAVATLDVVPQPATASP